MIKTIQPNSSSIFLRVLCVSAVALSSFGAGPKKWTHTSEADFRPGTFVNVVATNLGDLKLSRATRTLLEQDPRVSTVYALAQTADGTVYVGTGPQGVLLSVKDGNVTTVATIADSVGIFSLAIDGNGKLLIGTGGELGKIYRLDEADKPPVEIFTSPDVQYVWAMDVTQNGSIFAATGPNGQLVHIKPNGEAAVLFDSTESNLLSLARGKENDLYVGTDPNGIVYRVDAATGAARVLFDANETEISALVLDAAGNLYAATAQEVEAGESEAASEQIGRPEESVTGVTVPITPAGDTAPPDPNPGRPEPEPRQEPVGDVEDDKADAETVEHDESATESSASTDAGGFDAAEATGNAIYRIDPAGFVSEVFRGQTMIYSLLEENGSLLAGTGTEGYVYQIRPGAGENIAIAKLDSDQVMAMLPTKGGQILLGLANSGAVASMSRGFANEGTFTSDVLDATQVSLFGTLQAHGKVPEGAAVTLATRSGNLKDAFDENAWSAWSKEQPLAAFVKTDVPAGRFFQYRLTLKSGNAQLSPTVTDVTIPYQVPNLAPVVSSIKVTAAESAEEGEATTTTAVEPNRTQTVTWEATDPNEDTLHYTLSYRMADDGPWVEIKTDLTELTYTWDTKTVADGRYELRVTASDGKVNPAGQGRTASRVSDPVTVDNTAPRFTAADAVVEGTIVKVSLTAADGTNTISGVEYTVDSSQDWQAVAASDRIYDSPEESATFVTASLKPGPHQIAVRATDGNGNQAVKNLVITISPPARD